MGSPIGLSIGFKKGGGFVGNTIGTQIFAVALSIGFATIPGTTATLADQAAAVVVGEVTSGRQTGNSATFTLSVVRTLKGDVIPGAVLTVNAALQRSADRDLAGTYGMWFLRKIGSQWLLLPAQNGLFDTIYYPLSKAASPATITMNARPSTLSDRITVELAAALPLYSNNPLQFQILASNLLSAADSQVTKEIFQSFRSNPDPEIKFIGLARSVRNEADSSALAEIATNIDSAQRLKATFFVVPGVAGRLDTDPVAIGYLGKLANSSSPALQLAAANALMYIHTRDTLPFLAKLLDSNDATTREFAMRGLSRFAGNLPIATKENILSGRASLQEGPAPYRTPDTDRYSLATRSLAQAPEGEAPFVQFWKSWWLIMKDKVMK
jgi:hypothetical protein